MNENKGAKGGTRDSRLLRFFRKLFKKKKVFLEEALKEKESEEKKKKKSIIGVPGEEKTEKVEKTLDKNNPSTIVGQKEKVKPVTKVGLEEVKDKEILNKTSEEKLDDTHKEENKQDKSKKIEDICSREIPQVQQQEPKQIQNPEQEEKQEKENLVEVTAFTNITEEIQEEMIEEDIQKQMIEYLDHFIKDKKSELDKIKEEKELLEKQKDDILTSDEIDELYKHLQELKAREEQILREIKAISKDNTNLLNDPYFSHLVAKYKDVLKDTSNLNNSFSYPNPEIIERFVLELIQVDEQVNELEEVLGEKQEEQEIRDLNFEEYEEEFEDYDQSFVDISKDIEESAKMLEDLEKRIKDANTIVERTKIIVNKTNIALAPLLVTFAITKNNPLIPTTAGLLLRTAAVVNLLNSLFHPKKVEKTRVTITRPDFTKELQENIKSLDDVFALLDDTSIKVSDLRKNIEKELGDYPLPEYQEVMDKLEILEKEIEEKRYLLLDTKEKLHDNLDKNKVLIKEKEEV